MRPDPTLLSADPGLDEVVASFIDRWPSVSPADAEDQRSRIMRVTLEIAAAEGVKGASLRRIAGSTGMRTASLYSFFPGGKEELVSTALLEHLSAFYRDMSTALHVGAAAVETLRCLVHAHICWTLENPRVAPAILVLERAHAITPFLSAAGAQAIAQSHRLYRELLRAVLRELSIERDLDRLVELVIITCDSADFWHRAGPGRDVGVSAAQEFGWRSLCGLLGLRPSPSADG